MTPALREQRRYERALYTAATAKLPAAPRHCAVCGRAYSENRPEPLFPNRLPLPSVCSLTCAARRGS